MTVTLTVAEGPILVELLPELGGRLHRLCVFGQDLLRTPADPTAYLRQPFHWGGYVGSWGLMDPDSQVAFGYAPNNLDYGGGAITPRLAGFHQALMDILPELTP